VDFFVGVKDEVMDAIEDQTPEGEPQRAVFGFSSLRRGGGWRSQWNRPRAWHP